MDFHHLYFGSPGEILPDFMELKQGSSFPCSSVMEMEYGSGR